MLRHARGLAKSDCDAEDLTQEAVLRACRAISGFEGGRPLENWMMRILQRAYLDERRRRRRRPQTVSSDSGSGPGIECRVADFPAGDTGNPEHELMGGCLDERLERAFRSLSKELREAVWLTDVEGLKYREVADRVGVPVGTVRSRLHRAHRRLREAYLAG
jgi:RNA polymerase sigma-70 factor (ECF subfamily)